MIIVSDTSPLNYLVLIGYIDVLERLYGRVIVPQAVFNELQHERTPPQVKVWINAHPAWLEIKHADFSWFTPSKKIGNGEREAIALAKEPNAAVLIDDRDGTTEAHKNSLATVSTLTVLDTAARKNFLALPEAIDRLRLTTFCFPPVEEIKATLARDARRKTQAFEQQPQQDEATTQEQDHASSSAEKEDQKTG